MLKRIGVGLSTVPSTQMGLECPPTARVCTYETGYSRGYIYINTIDEARELLGSPETSEAHKGCARVYIEKMTEPRPMRGSSTSREDA